MVEKKQIFLNDGRNILNVKERLMLEEYTNCLKELKSFIHRLILVKLHKTKVITVINASRGKKIRLSTQIRLISDLLAILDDRRQWKNSFEIPRGNDLAF